MRLRNNPKAYDIMEENADFVILDPESHKGKYHQLFKENKPVFVEIGMGKGRSKKGCKGSWLAKSSRHITGQLGQAFHRIHKSTLSGQYCPDHCNDPEDHNDSLNKVIDGSGHISSKDHIDAGKGSHKDHTHRIRNVKSHPEQSGQAII